MVFWKRCYRVDVLCGYTCGWMVLFWDFLLGLLRTWNIGFGVFGVL